MDNPTNPEAVMHTLLLKPTEVAECLGIGRSKVYELIRAGALESVQIGTCRRVPETAVEQYINGLRTRTDVAS